MIIWKAKLDNGETIAGQIGNKSWSKLKDRLSKSGIKIIGLHLRHKTGKEVKMPDNCSAYFLSRKVRAHLMGGPRNQMFGGIGYADGKTVKISWFNAISMDHEGDEERDTKNALDHLIKND